MCCAIVVSLFGWCILTLAGAAIGSAKDRPLTGCALGCLLGPLGLVIAALMSQAYLCPYCGTGVKREFSLCPRCGQGLRWS